jgi:four helix bundle protein
MEGPLQTKTTDFAVDMIRFCSKLPADFRDIKSQIIRSGTSIGANVAESMSAVSKRDYVNKLGIALKEARETNYWLSVLNKFETVNKEKTANLKNDVNEIIKILSSIILTIKKRYNL